MFGQFKCEIWPIQLLELMGNIVPCQTINHANYNIKVHYGSQHVLSCS
jgi:hypothetical protein